jgi:hypothetical protein
MCDYSLCGIPNRLAIDGEQLVVHRFSTGAMGLASLADLAMHERLQEAAPKKTFSQRLKSFFAGSDRPEPIPAVCVPPGAQLFVKNIPPDLRHRHSVNQEEEAVFTQLSAEVNTYRDAIRFYNGSLVRLQGLHEGMPVRVLSLPGAAKLPLLVSDRKELSSVFVTTESHIAWR